MKLLLASKSPRRRQLLAELGYPVEFVDLDVDEHVDPSLPAAAIAEHLARRKAAQWQAGSPASDAGGRTVLVTADTVVVHRNQPLGKPADREAAVAMLRSLSGDVHQVYTGVCLRPLDDAPASSLQSFTECTDVHFKPLSDDEINYYVDHYRPYDKAGAYGIQEWIGMIGIERIEGCYYNVMGLPLAALYRHLQRFRCNG